MSDSNSQIHTLSVKVSVLNSRLQILSFKSSVPNPPFQTLSFKLSVCKLAASMSRFSNHQFQTLSFKPSVSKPQLQTFSSELSMQKYQFKTSSLQHVSNVATIYAFQTKLSNSSMQNRAIVGLKLHVIKTWSLRPPEPPWATSAALRPQGFGFSKVSASLKSGRLGFSMICGNLQGAPALDFRRFQEPWPWISENF